MKRHQLLIMAVVMSLCVTMADPASAESQKAQDVPPASTNPPKPDGPVVMNFNPQFTMRQVLEQAQMGKVKVELLLRNGQNLTGYVGGVSDHLVVLTNLQGKEFYDALVRIDDISVIQARVRSR